MTEVIKFPNTYATLRSLLIEITGFPVFVTRVPNPRPETFIMLEPSGGQEISQVHARRYVIIDAWAPTLEAAYDLAETVRAHLIGTKNRRLGDCLIYGASPQGGIVDLPDPDAKTPRYRQNFTLTIRGTAI